MKKQQPGFTIMELIVVIIVLGILSAFVIPKYMAVDKQARIAVVKAFYGSITAASEMAHGICLAKGLAGAAAADLGGGVIVNTTSTGYPTANSSIGVGNALTNSAANFNAVNVSANEVRYDYNGTAATTCSVDYVINNTASSPAITYATSGC
jgi:MSHA pilin protein MshA